MKLPKHIKVGAHRYTVQRSKKKVGDDEGICRFTETAIFLHPKLPLNKEQEVLVHEILHACAYPGIGDEDADKEEKFVTVVAPVLLQVIKDNPELLEYLCYKGKGKKFKPEVNLFGEKLS